MTVTLMEENCMTNNTNERSKAKISQRGMHYDVRNLPRVNRCEDVLCLYNNGWDEKDNLVDFLTDSRHWCDFHGLSFSDIDRQAVLHYRAEAMSLAGYDSPQDRRAATENQEIPDFAHELLSALDYLLEQTVDMYLQHGFDLSEGEADARAKALAVIAKMRR